MSEGQQMVGRVVDLTGAVPLDMLANNIALLKQAQAVIEEFKTLADSYRKLADEYQAAAGRWKAIAEERSEELIRCHARITDLER